MRRVRTGFVPQAQVDTMNDSTYAPEIAGVKVV